MKVERIPVKIDTVRIELNDDEVNMLETILAYCNKRMLESSGKDENYIDKCVQFSSLLYNAI